MRVNTSKSVGHLDTCMLLPSEEFQNREAGNVLYDMPKCKRPLEWIVAPKVRDAELFIILELTTQ